MDMETVVNQPLKTETESLQSQELDSLENDRDITTREVTRLEMEKTWSRVRESVALGMPIKEAAARFGVSYAAARKRSERECWATPKRVEMMKSKLAEGRPTVEIVAESLLERGEKFRKRLLERAESSIEAAELKPLEDWRDAKLALDIVDTITGLNRPQSATNILISGVGSVALDNESTDQSPYYRPLPGSAPENSEEPASEWQVIDVEEQW